MEKYQEEQLQRLQDAEAKAYARRDEAEKLIERLIGKKTDINSIFFVLRQAFAEFEDAESRCCVTTDRLNEYQSNL